jgi:hypothetical protein
MYEPGKNMSDRTSFVSVQNALRRATVLAALFGFLAPAAHGATWYQAGVVETRGLSGAYFTTALQVTNLGHQPASVRFALIPLAGTNAAPIRTLTIAPGESRRIENALKALFGLTQGVGTIAVTTTEPIQVSATTANVADSRGTYGLALPAIREGELLGAGETGHGFFQTQSADPTRGYRSNINVTLLEPGTGVELRVFDAEGALLGSTTLSGGPVTIQVSTGALIGAGTDLPVGRTEMTVTAGKALGFVVVNDNVTSDAIAFPFERVVAGATDVVLSGVAKTPGANGTNWSSDVRIFNPGPSAETVTLDALGFAQATSPLTRSVPAGGVVAIARVLDAFGLPDGVAGALRVRAAGPVFAGGRTMNADPSGNVPGTFSAQITPVRTWVQAGRTAYLAGAFNYLGVTAGFRTNVAILGGPAGATGVLVLRDSFGAVVTEAAFSRGPWEWGQVNSSAWFGGITIPDNARIDFAVGSGSASAYQSVVDNGTGDGVVAYAQLAPAMAPPTLTLSGPDSACADSAVTVSWEASDPDATVSIEGYGSGLPASGSVQVPVGLGTVTLRGRATNAAGPGPEASKSIASVARATAILSVAPRSVPFGRDVTVEWDVSESISLQTLVDSLEGRLDITETTLRTTTILRPRAGTHELTYEATTACGIVRATASYVVRSNCEPVVIQGFTSPLAPIAYGTDFTLSFTLAGDVTSWSLKSSLGNTILPFKGTTGGSLTATYRALNEAGLDTVTLTAEGPCGTASKSITITVESAP